MASPFAEALANPLLSKWLCVLKDAWFVTAAHLPVPQCQSIRQGRQPWEILSFLSAPSLRRGRSFKPPKPLATARPCCPTFASGFCPQEDHEATRAVLKLCPTNPAEPFAITFAPPREWLRVKDHVPPRTELHREGFKLLSSIQIQQTIYGLDE